MPGGGETINCHRETNARDFPRRGGGMLAVGVDSHITGTTGTMFIRLHARNSNRLCLKEVSAQIQAQN